MQNTLESKYSERDMVIDFCRLLEQENLVFAVEVPFMNRSVDLVFYKDDKIKAIEFKMHDWKKAVSQAKVHALGADEVYICLPSNYAMLANEMYPVLEENRCGLILFDIETKSMVLVFDFESKEPKWEKGVAIMRKGVDYSVQNGNYELLVGAKNYV